ARLRRDLKVRHPLQEKEPAPVVRGMAMTAVGESLDLLLRCRCRKCQRHTPAGRLVETCDAVEDRRLAGAVRSNDGGDVTTLSHERQVIDGEQTAKTHREVFDDQQRVGLFCHYPCPSLTCSTDTPLRLLR